MNAARRPGGELATRPLHFIWIADCSGSMYGDKIDALNTAIHDTVPHMRKVAGDNPNAQVLVRAISFNNGARWHMPTPTPVEQFVWDDLEAIGLTDMGHAMLLLRDALAQEAIGTRALPPVLVLLSDGQPTDAFSSSLAELLREPWARKAVRIAIAIGEDADHSVLEAFIDNPEMRVLQANNPETLVQYIRWVSTAVLQQASAPTSQTTNSPGGLASVPLPTVADSGIDANSVW